MKTPQEIIDALPEGNRKKAALMVSEQDPGNEPFWRHVQDGEFGAAAQWILAAWDETPHTSALIADMIWEG